jgi:hypothetical protein
MKTTLLSITAALALTCVSAVHAEDQNVQVKVQAQAKASHGYHLMQEEFHDFKNTYQLANGQKVAFSQRMARFYTQLNGGDRVEIYAVSPTAFVTDAGARIEFRDGGETVGISNFEKLPLAGHLPANTVMVASR